MRLNTASSIAPLRTHEGAPARHITAIQALRRSVCSAFLWEKEFYENGKTIAQRVLDLSAEVKIEDLAALAVEARHDMNLRHMPLLLLSALARRGSGQPIVANTIASVITRADEMAELISIHAHVNGVSPDKVKKVLPAQMKKGIAQAFTKFDGYALAKYDRPGAVRLKDVMFLTHPKPRDAAQAALWDALIKGEMAIPDTWETALSGGADKKETFTRLLMEGKLGYLALLRNLRNMVDADVDETLIRDAIVARKGADRVLPFRFTAAARACPRMEGPLDEALTERVLTMPCFSGRTIIMVDVSGSMKAKLSDRSDMSRMDAAATLGSIIHGDRRVFTFSDNLIEVPARIGMAGVDTIIRSQRHSGTALGEAVARINKMPHDRLIVITDEQSRSPVPAPVAKNAYMINVASARHGVGYGTWTHIDGFSENVLRFIHAHEEMAG